MQVSACLAQNVIRLQAASRVEVGWPFILDVSSHPMPWQADNTVPWTIAVPIDWLKRRNVFMKEFQVQMRTPQFQLSA